MRSTALPLAAAGLILGIAVAGCRDTPTRHIPSRDRPTTGMAGRNVTATQRQSAIRSPSHLPASTATFGRAATLAASEVASETVETGYPGSDAIQRGRAPRAPNVALLPLVVASGRTFGPPAAISGERRKWHRVTLSFEGPEVSENATPNPYRDFRMDVEFTHVATGKLSMVPGHFAADGQAAETSAQLGSVWRVHFAPDLTGEWVYRVRFRTGSDVAVSDDPQAGRPIALDGATGSFTVLPTDKTGRDFRAKGMLQYVGGHHLRFAETGEYYLKGGPNSPENFLGYFEFDNTVDQGGHGNDLPDGLHHYEPHLRDWKDGDPVWQERKGKGIVGALNYLASTGMNNVYFLTMNIGGDGREVYPWENPAVYDRYDVSKLDQWEIVFQHMDKLGIAMHVVLQEAENDQVLDDGELGPLRRVYYRELISRFAHHPAVTWNLGEENTNTTAQRKAHAQYLRNLDPYDHPITVHTAPGAGEALFAPLLGFRAFEGPSLQSNKISDVNEQTRHWFEQSEKAGRPWITTADELGSPQVGAQPDASDPDRPRLRSEGLWGNLMGGGGGVEWFFGIGHAHNDLDMEDWRSRANLWTHTRQALDFFHAYLPFHEMRPCNGLLDGDKSYCLGKEGEVYAVYLLRGGTVEMDLDGVPHPLHVRWFNPRAGGGLQRGSVATIAGPGEVGIGVPPSEGDRDWVALITRTLP